jgi:sugar lactone lactonase YvrE
VKIVQQFVPNVERAFACDTAVGESPLWDAEKRTLYWVDIPSGRVFHGDPTTGLYDTRVSPTAVGSLALCRDRHLLVATGAELQRWSLQDAHGAHEAVARIPQRSAASQFNDGKAGPDGRFWVGVFDPAPAPVRRPVGAVYGLGSTQAPSLLTDNLLVPNGIAWSPAGDRMVFSDSGQAKVWSLPFDPHLGPLAAPEPWLDWRRDELGAPDGAAMDADGCYWSCGIFSGAIHRFDPTGAHIESYRLPISQPTMCCFGGLDLKTLFVTNMTVLLEPAQRAAQPLAGSVIAFKVNTAGAPVGMFG